MVKARLVAGDPSVLTADRVCVIWALRVSLSRIVSETNESCRKPAPFGKGRARMPDIERSVGFAGRETDRAFISQELVRGRGIVRVGDDGEV